MFQVNIGDAYLQCSFHVLIFPVPRDRAPWSMDLDGDDEDESPENEAAEDRFSEKCTLFWLPILFFFVCFFLDCTRCCKENITIFLENHGTVASESSTPLKTVRHHRNFRGH